VIYQHFNLLWIRVYWIDHNRFCRLNQTIAMAIRNIMRHQKLLFRINVAKAAVRDAISASYLVVKLPTWSNLISIIV
jgi:hypothetical protein